MKRQELKWCGEGDLFSRPLLKTRKLYTSRSSQSSQSATNTKSSHTASHTARNGERNLLELASCRTGMPS
jgi:hypothetical protein